MRWPASILAAGLLILSGAACSISGASQAVRPTPNESEMRATLAAMQSTLDSSQQNARATAEAWMTQTTSDENAAGQTAPTLIPSGTIRGKLSFPSEGIPPLKVVAINIYTGEYYSVEVKDREEYSLVQVPEGQYHVLAYPMEGSQNLVGGYSTAVECGLSADCTDHSLVVVEVKSGEVVTGVDPGDWYAPAGTFPPSP